MDFLLICAAACAAFVGLGALLELLGLIPGPCDCSECRRARRDPFRPF